MSAIALSPFVIVIEDNLFVPHKKTRLNSARKWNGMHTFEKGTQGGKHDAMQTDLKQHQQAWIAQHHSLSLGVCFFCIIVSQGQSWRTTHALVGAGRKWSCAFIAVKIYFIFKKWIFCAGSWYGTVARVFKAKASETWIQIPTGWVSLYTS